MSDFFYKEKFGPVFSPVIKIKHEKMPSSVVSAIDNLLSPKGNMFTRAETVKNLMSIEKLGVEETARVLSLKMEDVAGKLRLLEFSEAERGAILDYGFSEQDALQFLRLDKVTRLYNIECCHKKELCGAGLAEYIDEIVTAKSAKKKTPENKPDFIRKQTAVDVGFFFNSIENILGIAKRAGFEVVDEKTETGDCYDIHIRVKKHGAKE